MTIEMMPTPAWDTALVPDGRELLQAFGSACARVASAFGSGLARDERDLLDHLQRSLRDDGSLTVDRRTAGRLARSFEDAALATGDPGERAEFLTDAADLRAHVC